MLERLALRLYGNTYDMNNNNVIHTQQSEDEELVIKGK